MTLRFPHTLGGTPYLFEVRHSFTGNASPEKPSFLRREVEVFQDLSVGAPNGPCKTRV
jgi:hypothetical protein